MRANRYRVMILLLALCGSCITPFDPEIEEHQEVLVINGYITDQSGPHRVEISRSSPFSTRYFVAVSGCAVTVEDETGEMISYTEISPGVHEAILEPGFLQVGKSYALYVSTPDGSEYRSEYEPMIACPPIELIYYEVKERGTSSPDITHYGLQFFVDVKGSSETATSFRWLMEETWEYTAPYIPDLIWFGKGVLPYNADSTYQCQITTEVKNLFSASTRYLTVNQLNRNPLHYVSNQTPRLSIRYSVLVEQQSLSNEAFAYWDKMRAQTSGGESLYESQPSSAIGNIYNINDPNEKVLGYFYATQVQQERITLTPDFDFNVQEYTCALDSVFILSELENDFPHYFIELDTIMGPPYLHGGKNCFDCRAYGGTIAPGEY